MHNLPKELMPLADPATRPEMFAQTLPRRGRPREMTDQKLLERIRGLAESRDGLFRVHDRNLSLYSRARRSFGSWSAAVQAAGLDYLEAVSGARLRSLKTRRRMRRSGRG